MTIRSTAPSGGGGGGGAAPTTDSAKESYVPSRLSAAALAAKADAAALGSAAAQPATAFDPAGAAAAAQAYAVQRANHTGSQSADTVTDGSTNKAYTAAEKTKVGGITAGATANATDAQLRDRATHTGTQAASTVTGLPAAVALAPTVTKTAPYTAAVGDLAMMNVPGGGTVLTLPNAPANRSQVGYRAIGATATAPLTINRGGTDTIGTAGATTASIVMADETIVLQYDAPNTRWLAVANARTQASLDAAYATLTQTTQTGTAYTLALADANTLVESNNAAAVTLTVPPNSAVAFPVGTTIGLRQYGAGQVTVAAGAGVTVRSRGAALKLFGQYAEGSLTKRATDEWVLSGDLT